MFYLTVGFITLAVYCVALTVVVRREIKDIRNSINQCRKSIRRCWNDVDDNADDISDIRSEVMKANEVFSDLWDRIDATVDKMLDVRVENILMEKRRIISADLSFNSLCPRVAVLRRALSFFNSILVGLTFSLDIRYLSLLYNNSLLKKRSVLPLI